MNREQRRAWDARPENVQRRREYQKRRRGTAAGRAYERAYANTPQRKAYERAYAASVEGRAKQLVHRAARRHREMYGGTAQDFAPTWQEVAAHIRRGCAVTGLPFDLSPKPPGEGRRQKWSSPSLDRIKSDSSYTAGNWRVVLFAVNCALGTWGDDVLSLISRAIANRK
jgi:hypothetical protein